jgi:hypothetical protein
VARRVRESFRGEALVPLRRPRTPISSLKRSPADCPRKRSLVGPQPLRMCRPERFSPSDLQSFEVWIRRTLFRR